MACKICKAGILFLAGYCIYIAIEVTIRGVSYPIMGVCGGLAVLILDKINSDLSWDTDLLIQSLYGGILITFFELLIGELSLHTGIFPVMWDYSDMPLNLDGVICLPFSALWCLMSVLAIFLADAINYYVLDEHQVPYYKLFGKTVLRFKEKNSLSQ